MSTGIKAQGKVVAKVRAKISGGGGVEEKSRRDANRTEEALWGDYPSPSSPSVGSFIHLLDIFVFAFFRGQGRPLWEENHQRKIVMTGWQEKKGSKTNQKEALREMIRVTVSGEMTRRASTNCDCACEVP